MDRKKPLHRLSRDELKLRVLKLIHAVNALNLPEEEKRLHELTMLLKQLEEDQKDDEIHTTLKNLIYHYEMMLPLQKLCRETKFIQEYLDKNG
jgi:hypothetical protein